MIYLRYDSRLRRVRYAFGIWGTDIISCLPRKHLMRQRRISYRASDKSFYTGSAADLARSSAAGSLLSSMYPFLLERVIYLRYDSRLRRVRYAFGIWGTDIISCLPRKHLMRQRRISYRASDKSFYTGSAADLARSSAAGSLLSSMYPFLLERVIYLRYDSRLRRVRYAFGIWGTDIISCLPRKHLMRQRRISYRVSDKSFRAAR